MPAARPALAVASGTPARALAGRARRAIGTFVAGLVAATAVAVALAQGTGPRAGAEGLAPIPPLTARVTDLTQTLSAAERQALDAKLADWEARTTNQLAVLLVPTTQPEPIEAYSIRVAEAWKIGHKGSDNGVLMVVAKNDRKLRIEVGYGLEGTLTDVTSHRIIDEDIAPKFREGRYAAGIEAGVDRIIRVVAEGKPLPPRTDGGSSKRPRRGFDLDLLFIVVFMVVPIVGSILRSIFGKLPGAGVGAALVGGAAWLVFGSLVVAIVAAVVGFVLMLFFSVAGGLPGSGGGPRGGGWGGGGWGGGGGGGISGGGGFSGGGGSFGGGGASGSW